MKSREKLLEFLRTTLETDHEHILGALADRAVVVRVAKGTKLFTAGETMEHLYFLCDGIVRMYYSDAKGAEITEWLVGDIGAVIFPCYDMSEDAFARASSDAITDCELVRVPLAVFRELIRTYQEFDRIRLRMLQAVLDRQAKLKRSLWHLTPSERYDWLVQNRPLIAEKVPQKYIASYLGMTPVSLSRIRSRQKERLSEE